MVCFKLFAKLLKARVNELVADTNSIPPTLCRRKQSLLTYCKMIETCNDLNTISSIFNYTT